jgi:hypothetical protein
MHLGHRRNDSMFVMYSSTVLVLRGDDDDDVVHERRLDKAMPAAHVSN